jgi:hypothetical protein
MTTNSDIVASIDTHLRQCREQITRLEAARAALSGQSGPAHGSGVARVRPSRTRATHFKTRPVRAPVARQENSATASPADTAPSTRKPADRPRTSGSQLEAALSNSDGLTSAVLAHETGAERSHVLGLLRELETAGRVRRSGQRRGTRWHAVTDGDRNR